MNTKYKALAQKIFTEIGENSVASHDVVEDYKGTEGVIKSVNEFVKLVNEACAIYYKTFNVPDRDQIVVSEDFPGGLLQFLQNDTADITLSEKNKHDINIVTYLFNESPAVLSARKLNEDGIRNIKWKYEGTYNDPDFTGYSISRYTKEIEANVTFKVWGRFFQDIRVKASLLKDIIDKNTWFFKHKGLRDIIWEGSFEEEVWDNKNIAKYKTERYLIRFSEIKELREKNIEQVVVQYGLN